MSGWVIVTDSRGAMTPLFVEVDRLADVAYDVVAALHSAGQELPDLRASSQVSPVMIDSPGLCLSEQRWRRADVSGLVVLVPSREWRNLLYYLRLTPVWHTSTGAQLYRMMSWRGCVILTPEQREGLIATMEEQLAEAEAEAEADNKRMNALVAACAPREVGEERVAN